MPKMRSFTNPGGNFVAENSPCCIAALLGVGLRFALHLIPEIKASCRQAASGPAQIVCSRRGILKGATAVAGAAIGSGAITGFPTIWAQNIKDVVLITPVRRSPRSRRSPNRPPRIWVSPCTCRRRRMPTCSTVSCRSPARSIAPTSAGLHALPDRPQRAAGHPAQQVQILGQDHPAAHQGRISRRPQGAAAGHHADDGPVCHGRDGQKVTDGTPTEFVTGIPPLPTATRLAFARTWSGARSIAGPICCQPGFQGQGGAAGQPDHRHHRCRDGAGGARRHQVRQQGQHDEARDRQDDRYDACD